MPLKSRMKGKRGEREAVLFLKSLGYQSARRTQQYAGADGDSDVTCDELPGLHIEVKFGYPLAKFDLGSSRWLAAIEQCRRDAPAGSADWIILWKPKGHQQWRATCGIDGIMATVVGEDVAKLLLAYAHRNAL